MQIENFLMLFRIFLGLRFGSTFQWHTVTTHSSPNSFFRWMIPTFLSPKLSSTTEVLSSLVLTGWVSNFVNRKLLSSVS